jgi:hypothetical protein
MNFSGNDSRFQIGKEATYGAALTQPTQQLEILNESVHQVNISVESEALVGAVTTPFYSVVGVKVEGDVSIEVHPDNIGLLIAAALGKEADVVGATAFTHSFTPAKGGDSLPSLAAVVDKKADIFMYQGLKIDTMTLETDPGSLLTSSISFIGQKEGAGGSLVDALTPSTVNPFHFNHMYVYFGTAGAEAATNIGQAVSFSFNYSNNLENDLFVADGTPYMAEIDYQKRDITFDIETLYDDDINAYRAANYKTGEKLSVKVEFIHDQNVVSGTKYKLVLDMLNCVITEAPNDIGGAERMRIPLSFRALETGGDEAITIKVVNAEADKY